MGMTGKFGSLFGADGCKDGVLNAGQEAADFGATITLRAPTAASVAAVQAAVAAGANPNAAVAAAVAQQLGPNHPNYSDLMSQASGLTPTQMSLALGAAPAAKWSFWRRLAIALHLEKAS